jgi:hypothetical protein
MLKWLFIALLALQAHFAASYLVPLDAQAQQTFGGLLRWAWPWSIGDSGPLGRMTTSGFPLAGFFLAVTAGGALILAAMAVARVWVPFGWWRVLAIAGAVLSLLLMVLFFSPTKLLPMAAAGLILAIGLGYWPAVAAAFTNAPTTAAAPSGVHPAGGP